MSKKPEMSEAEMELMTAYIKSLPKPKPVPMRTDVREYFETVVLPTVKDQAMSELQRSDGVTPRLISFMNDGSLGIVDVAEATGGTFGSYASKEATAKVHRISAMIPGVRMVVFVSEVWLVDKRGSQITPEVMEEARQRTSIADHPDREEGVMFNALHYDMRTGEMMQLMYTIEVLKVLGAKRSRNTWRDTKWGPKTMVMDPMEGGEPKVTGRFSIADPENDDEL